MDRRDVIQRVLMGGAALIVIPSAFTSCEKKTEPDPDTNPTPGPGPSGSKITVDLSLPANAVLNSAGGSKIIQNLLVVNTGNAYIALSSVCTHEGCTVEFDSSVSNIKCPCHGSSFSTSGSVITGPATKALTSYQASKTDNILTINL